MDGNVLSTEPSFSRGFNVAGTYQKTLTVTDDKGVSTSASIKIIVLPAVVTETNTAPTATAQSVAMDEDTTRDITLSGADTDGNTLTYTIVTPPSHGTLNGTAPNVNYTPTADYFGSGSFTFKVNDGIVDSAVATVDITINDVAEPNQVPTVTAQADANITEGTPFTPTATATDSDGTIASMVWSEGGTELTFPKKDFSIGEHTLTVTVTDDDGATATDMMLLTVKPCLKLPKTGQITSYDTDGNIVTDGSVKDDGFYQAGSSTTPRFTRDANSEVVTDQVTGLEWQADAAVATVTKPWVTQANYDAGDYNNTAGDTADTYCKTLSLDGGGWRLPAIEELMYISDKGSFVPAIDSTFENIAQSLMLYWSVTSRVGVGKSHIGWVLDFSNGMDGAAYEKDYAFYVRCVRGENKIQHHFIRDDSKEVVRDTVACLEWQDNMEANSTVRDWQGAINYCETLDLDGGGWRLPNFNELFSIADRKKVDPSINNTFLNVSSNNYWSATNSPSVFTYAAWSIGFKVGASVYYRKNDRLLTRCVRDTSLPKLTIHISDQEVNDNVGVIGTDIDLSAFAINVQVGATYEIVDDPTDGKLTIDTDTGIVTWLGNLSSGTDYTIEVKVTNPDGSTVTDIFNLHVNNNG